MLKWRSLCIHWVVKVGGVKTGAADRGTVFHFHYHPSHKRRECMCCTFMGLNIFVTYNLNRRKVKTHHMFKKSYFKKTCMYINIQKGHQLNVTSAQTQNLTVDYKERAENGVNMVE